MFDGFSFQIQHIVLHIFLSLENPCCNLNCIQQQREKKEKFAIFHILFGRFYFSFFLQHFILFSHFIYMTVWWIQGWRKTEILQTYLFLHDSIVLWHLWLVSAPPFTNFIYDIFFIHKQQFYIRHFFVCYRKNCNPIFIAWNIRHSLWFTE